MGERNFLREKFQLVIYLKAKLLYFYGGNRKLRCNYYACDVATKWTGP
jgi:hypothetical protein